MMESIIVKPKNKEEMKLISSVLHKMKIQSTLISEEELQDIGLAVLMNKAKTTERVSREKVMESLSKK